MRSDLADDVLVEELLLQSLTDDNQQTARRGVKFYAHDTVSTCLLRSFMHLAFSHTKGAIFRFTVFDHLLLHVLPRFYLQHDVTYVT